MEPESTIPAIQTPAPAPGILTTKLPATASFAVGLILFLLPFAEVRCNGTSLASNTGIGLAFGTGWKETVTRSFGNGFGDKSVNYQEQPGSHESNIFAIVALLCGAAGLLLAALAPQGGGKLTMAIGIAGAVSLVALLVDLKSKINSHNPAAEGRSDGIGDGIVTIDGTGAFFFTLFLFALGALFSYLRVKGKQPT